MRGVYGHQRGRGKEHSHHITIEEGEGKHHRISMNWTTTFNSTGADTD
jgi:hypothetical protein